MSRTMKTTMGVLVLTALAPFGLSLVPTLYVVLVYYYPFTYPVTAVYGLLWCALCCCLYWRTNRDERRTLRWLALLAIFAFVYPAHRILMALGVPPFLPHNFTPS